MSNQLAKHRGALVGLMSIAAFLYMLFTGKCVLEIVMFLRQATHLATSSTSPVKQILLACRLLLRMEEQPCLE